MSEMNETCRMQHIYVDTKPVSRRYWKCIRL